jgi:protein-S-isoprenylcysteine O-methyltransferase Ste14
MIRRVFAALGTALFLVLAPGFVAGVVPWWITQWKIEPAFLFLRWIGAVLIAMGAIGLLDSFVRFALQGIGTPAPAFPTRHLVVSGLYRYVRNPMYLSLATVIAGQSLLFANARLLGYGALVWLACHLFVLFYEEPILKAAFGPQYAKYRREVPRWIPQLNPSKDLR